MSYIFKELNYYPYLRGKYDVSPAFNVLKLNHLSDIPDNYLFQIDQNFEKYIKNKEECRRENIEKYYQQYNLADQTKRVIIEYIINNLITYYPNNFVLEKSNINTLNCLLTNEKIIYDNQFNLISEKYTDLLDAICSQVQEDIVICSMDKQNDWLSFIHLCSPNYWSAQEKIGKNFSEIHEYVAGMEKIRSIYRPILESVIKKGPFFRFAWEINTDNLLNHHPEKIKSEKKFNSLLPELFVRVERQCLIGFEEINTILFTIKTYYKDILELNKQQINFLNKSLLSMSAETLKYKRLENDLKDISDYLTEIETEAEN